MAIFLQNANVEEVLKRSYENNSSANTVICPLCLVELVYSYIGINSHMRKKHMSKKEITRDEMNKLVKQLLD